MGEVEGGMIDKDYFNEKLESLYYTIPAHEQNASVLKQIAIDALGEAIYLIADDSYAITFQSISQYRSALIKSIASLVCK
jgi:hypothetical protein